MADNWLSVVWYDNQTGLEVTSVRGDPTSVRGPTYWRVHWGDPTSRLRVWMVTDTGQEAAYTCTLLQAALPGVTIYWANIPPEQGFPLGPGRTPDTTIYTC